MVLLLLVRSVSLPGKMKEALVELEGTAEPFEKAYRWMGTVTEVFRTGTGTIPLKARNPRSGSNRSFFPCSKVGRVR